MSFLYGDPCVFAVGHEYQIAFNTLEYGVAWVEVNGKRYNSSRGGLMLSETLIHKISLPMAELDAARSYRVCFRDLKERKPYFPELGPLQRADYAFRPVEPGRPIRACMLADTHSRVAEPLKAAACCGEIDLLILNGDIPAESKTPEDIRAIYDLTSGAAHGNIPVVFARGNHDYRGRLATELADYISTEGGNTWFTFRVGALWGIVLDCGEDKDDASIEYGGLVDCHAMRLAETDFLRDVIARADEEYLAPGVTTRIAISHIPFPITAMENHGEAFIIEKPVFAQWTELMNEMQLDVLLAGHMHDLYIARPGTPDMRMNANFPTLVGSAVYTRRPCPIEAHKDATFIGLGLEMHDGSIKAVTIGDDGAIAEFYSNI